MTDGDTGVRRLVSDGRYLLEFDSLPSTMDVARLALMADDRSIIGVRGDHQSRGRGRRGAPWVAPPRTCLLVTYLLRSDIAPDPARLAFSGGVAVAEAIESVTGLKPGLKWPNDVLLNGRKTAGILVEAHGRNALIGIGLNVNVDSFPPDLQSAATSLKIESGRAWSVACLEEAVRTRLFELQSVEWPAVLALWRGRDQTEGRRYLAVLDGAECLVTAAGVCDSGALLARTSSGQIVPVLSATGYEQS